MQERDTRRTLDLSLGNEQKIIKQTKSTGESIQYREQSLSKDTDAAKSLQSCPTLCDPIDVSPRGSPVPGILQARTLEWVPISFSNAGKWKEKVKSLGCVRLLGTPWTAAHQAPPSMGFSRQEYWSGLPMPSPYCYHAMLSHFSLQYLTRYR